MPYAFAPRANAAVGESRELDLPMGDWAALKFEQGAHDTFFNATSRFTEDQIWDNGDLMRPDVATKVFGVPGYLKFDAPISIQRARLMQERKQEELRRLAYLNAATHSAFSVKGALGLGAGMVGSVSNPLDFALMFIPFVGSEKAAAGVAMMGRSKLQQMAARGILTTEESLAQFTRFPRFGASVINGAMGNAVTEIPVFAQNVRDQAIYGPQDAALNVFLGGVTGGALHVAGAAFGRLLRSAAEAHDRMSPELQDAAARRAVNQVLDDEPISVDGIARTDSEAITRDIQFDEAASRARALESIGVLPEEARARVLLEIYNRKQASAIDLLDLANEKVKAEPETADAKSAERLLQSFRDGERGVGLFRELADLFGLRYNPLAKTIDEQLKSGNLPDTFGLGPVRNKATRIAALEARISELELDFKKGVRDGPSARALDRLKDWMDKLIAGEEPPVIDPETLNSHISEVQKAESDARIKAKELEVKAEAVRKQRVMEFIESERAKHQASIDGKRTAAQESDIQQRIRDGKILTDKEVADFTKNPTDESGMKAIKESVASLEAELRNIDPENPVTKIIQREIQKIEDEPDISKAYETAAACLARNP